MIYSFIKRVMDVTLSFFGILVLSPILIVVALAIKISSPGPVLADIPQRVGKDKKVFKMYKFRSMIKNAHDVLRSDPKYRDVYNKYKDGNFKVKTDEDPRITKFGRFLRKTSLDEFPQLFNVLSGEMSLVGPRAFHTDELEEQLNKYPQTRFLAEKTLKLKPGITGPWQVGGRSAVDFPNRIKINAEYAENQNIVTDLVILLKTIPAVIRGEGN